MSNTNLNVPEELTNLPAKVLKRFAETLRSEAPVATGSFVALVDGEKCGCLIFDGIKSRNPDLMKWLNDRILGTEDSESGVGVVAYRLTRFYGLTYADFGGKQQAVNAYDQLIVWFDDWARARDHDRRRHIGCGNNYILTNAGKAECLQLVEAALAAKTPA